jgi:hypothetical protein
VAASFHTRPISTLHLAWAAGFIEGEGSFSVSGRKSACVTAAQVQREPIERLQALFGGRVVQRCTKGHSSKPIWVWTLPSRRSIEVMMTLYVLMSPRRQEQIEAALAMWKSQSRILRPHGSNICGNGHELTDDNVYITAAGHKKCRSCALGVKKEMRKRGCLGIAPKKRENWEPARGEQNSSAKLSDQEVIDIRAAIAGGTRQVDLARKYGVTPTLISMIKKGEHRA